jgi:DNA polymerase III epsilon subunit family exonuclease
MSQNSANTPSAFLSKPITVAEFLVIDLEMTGLDPFDDDIIEVAAVPMIGMEIVGDIFYSEVRPQKKISPAAKAIHGIHGKQLSQAPSIEDVMPEIAKLFSRRIIVAHSVMSDIQFLRAKSKITGIELPLRPLVDTARLAKYFSPAQKKPNLDELLFEFKIEPRRGNHNAFNDALLTADVFSKMVYDLKVRGKVMFIGDILRFGGA